MESFVKWGREKRQLDEVLGKALGVGAVGTAIGAAAVTGGLLPALGAGAVIGGVAYLWNSGKNKKEAKGEFWVFKKDAEEGDQKKVFDGPTIVKMYDNKVLKDDDLFYPPGAQNWMKIGDSKKSKKLLPWEQSKSVGNAGTLVDDNTKWVAIIDGKKKTYEGSKVFAKAIADREVEEGTLVWHSGYGQKWKKYGSKDVDDDIGKYVAEEGPSLGDTKLMGANSWYVINGTKYGPVKFEDLVGVGLKDDSWVWVKGYNKTKDWVKFKEVKKKLPSMGQAHVSSPRGTLGKLGNYIASNNVAGNKKTAYEKPDDDIWKKGKTSLTP